MGDSGTNLGDCSHGGLKRTCHDCATERGPWELAEVPRPFFAPKNTWLGDFQSPDGQHIGGLYKAADNVYRVWAVAPFGSGKIVRELPRVLHKGEFKVVDSLQVSASQRVRIYAPA
jgi:hypothetical protein